MLIPWIFDDRAPSFSRVPPQSGQCRERDRSLHERSDVRLHRVDVLGEEGLLHPGHQALVGDVDAVDLHLDRLAVEEVLQLDIGVLPNRLVGVEEARLGEHPRRPAIRGVAGDGDRSPGQRLALVVDLAQVDVGHRPHALAARAHPAELVERALHGLLPSPPRSIVIAPLPLTVGMLNENACGEPMCGCPSRLNRMRSIALASVTVPTVERALASHPLLVDDDRRRQPIEHIDVGSRERRHECLHEGAVGLIDHPLRLRGDRVEHQ